MTYIGGDRGRDEMFTLKGQPATFLTMHGTAADLNTVLTVMQRQGRVVLANVGPLPCAPGSDCYRMHLVVSGAFDVDEMDLIGDQLGWTRVDITHRT